MLGKLFKHEFRATWIPPVLICIAVIAAGGLVRLFVLFSDLNDFFSIPMVLMTVFWFLLIAAASTAILGLSVFRFYKNVYGDEGYLTLTLPVKRSSIILSKLIPTLVWMYCGTAAICISLLLVSVSSDFGDFIGEVMADLDYLFSIISGSMKTPLFVFILEFVLFLIISSALSILTFYAAVSIGQLFGKHRLIGSIVGYLAVNTLGQIVMNLYMLTASFTLSDLMDNPLNLLGSGLGEFNLQVNIILYLLITALLALLCYLITHYVMKKSVNLR